MQMESEIPPPLQKEVRTVEEDVDLYPSRNIMKMQERIMKTGDKTPYAIPTPFDDIRVITDVVEYFKACVLALPKAKYSDYRTAFEVTTVLDKIEHITLIVEYFKMQMEHYKTKEDYHQHEPDLEGLLSQLIFEHGALLEKDETRKNLIQITKAVRLRKDIVDEEFPVQYTHCENIKSVDDLKNLIAYFKKHFDYYQEKKWEPALGVLAVKLMFNPKILENRLAELMKEIATFYGLLLQRNFNRRKAFIAFTADRKCCNFYDLWEEGPNIMQKVAGDLKVKQSLIALLFQILYWRLVKEQFAFVAYTDNGQEYQFFDLDEKITEMRVITKHECGNCIKIDTEENPLSITCLMCDRAAYCNKTCQKEDWLNHHSQFCHYVRQPVNIEEEEEEEQQQKDPFRSHCAFCHAPESEGTKLKPCLLCHEAYYCSKECQINDLAPYHQYYCQYRRDIFSTKKKPTLTNVKQEWLPGCYSCEKTNVALQWCGRCGVVSYCSGECQKKDWKERHSIQCKELAAYYKQQK